MSEDWKICNLKPSRALGASLALVPGVSNLMGLATWAFDNPELLSLSHSVLSSSNGS